MSVWNLLNYPVNFSFLPFVSVKTMNHCHSNCQTSVFVSFDAPSVFIGLKSGRMFVDIKKFCHMFFYRKAAINIQHSEAHKTALTWQRKHLSLIKLKISFYNSLFKRPGQVDFVIWVIKWEWFICHHVWFYTFLIWTYCYLYMSSSSPRFRQESWRRNNTRIYPCLY